MAFPNSSARKTVFLFESFVPSLAPTGGIKRQGAPVKRSLGGANPQEIGLSLSGNRPAHGIMMRVIT